MSFRNPQLGRYNFIYKLKSANTDLISLFLPESREIWGYFI